MGHHGRDRAAARLRDEPVRGPIRSIAELGNRVRVTIGPVSAEITADSLRRLGLELGQTAYASFKATGTRVVANGKPY